MANFEYQISLTNFIGKLNEILLRFVVVENLVSSLPNKVLKHEDRILGSKGRVLLLHIKKKLLSNILITKRKYSQY